MVLGSSRNRPKRDCCSVVFCPPDVTKPSGARLEFRVENRVKQWPTNLWIPSHVLRVCPASRASSCVPHIPRFRTLFASPDNVGSQQSETAWCTQHSSIPLVLLAGTLPICNAYMAYIRLENRTDEHRVTDRSHPPLSSTLLPSLFCDKVNWVGGENRMCCLFVFVCKPSRQQSGHRLAEAQARRGQSKLSGSVSRRQLPLETGATKLNQRALGEHCGFRVPSVHRAADFQTKPARHQRPPARPSCWCKTRTATHGLSITLAMRKSKNYCFSMLVGSAATGMLAMLDFL